MGASAREAALEVLERCRRDNAWSGASIDSTIRRHSLEGREAALASRLCLGVLQNSAYCDYYIDFFHKGGSKNLQPGIRSILRLGAYQILFLDKIPVHAAVDECVNLCRKHKYDRASGLVNAILRRIAEHREDLPPIPGAGSAEYLSIRYSHPLWLVRRLIQEQGYAFTEAFLAANNTPPELSLQVNTLKVEASAYARALERAEIPFHAVPELPGCLLLEGGGITVGNAAAPVNVQEERPADNGDIQRSQPSQDTEAEESGSPQENTDSPVTTAAAVTSAVTTSASVTTTVSSSAATTTAESTTIKTSASAEASSTTNAIPGETETRKRGGLPFPVIAAAVIAAAAAVGLVSRKRR